MWRFPINREKYISAVQIHVIDSSLTHKSEILTSSSSSSAAVETTVGTGVAAGDNVVGETIIDREKKFMSRDMNNLNILCKLKPHKT